MKYFLNISIVKCLNYFPPLNDTETHQVPVGYRCNLAQISACIQKYRSNSCLLEIYFQFTVLLQASTPNDNFFFFTSIDSCRADSKNFQKLEKQVGTMNKTHLFSDQSPSSVNNACTNTL